MMTKLFLPNIQEYRIVLASQSPRRQELLAKLGLEFTSRHQSCDETYPESLHGKDIVEFVAKKKADSCDISCNELIITADTIVQLDKKVYGKPADKETAKDMLHNLSGRMHEVFTGVCLYTTAKKRVFSAVSEVTFAPITDDEINFYVENYNPIDKAGAYGIQEWIGYIGIKAISGSFWNVMGLPLHQLYKELTLF